MTEAAEDVEFEPADEYEPSPTYTTEMIEAYAPKVGGGGELQGVAEQLVAGTEAAATIASTPTETVHLVHRQPPPPAARPAAVTAEAAAPPPATLLPPSGMAAAATPLTPPTPTTVTEIEPEAPAAAVAAKVPPPTAATAVVPQQAAPEPLTQQLPASPLPRTPSPAAGQQVTDTAAVGVQTEPPPARTALKAAATSPHPAPAAAAGGAEEALLLPLPPAATAAAEPPLQLATSVLSEQTLKQVVRDLFSGDRERQRDAVGRWYHPHARLHGYMGGPTTDREGVYRMYRYIPSAG